MGSRTRQESHLRAGASCGALPTTGPPLKAVEMSGTDRLPLIWPVVLQWSARLVIHDVTSDRGTLRRINCAHELPLAERPILALEVGCLFLDFFDALWKRYGYCVSRDERGWPRCVVRSTNNYDHKVIGTRYREMQYSNISVLAFNSGWNLPHTFFSQPHQPRGVRGSAPEPRRGPGNVVICTSYCVP